MYIESKGGLMFNKLYDKLKKNLKENILSIGIIIFVWVICWVEFPYYIDAPGSIIDIKKRVSIDDFYDSKGSFYMASVSEIKGIIPTLIWAYFDKSMDIVKRSEKVYNNETYEEANMRGRLLLNNSLDNATLVAYTTADKEYNLLNEKLYVILVEDYAETDLKVGDEIISIDNKKITSTSELRKFITSKKEGDKINILVRNGDTQINKSATVKNIDGNLYVGIAIMSDFDIEVEPSIEFTFPKSESGSSGGLMLALSIYNSLVEEDITRGKKIVGTGTIDAEGNVGSIGGVKYKIAAAVREGIKIFIVPKDNYEEAREVVEENNYDIALIVTSTFEETLEKLKSL